MKQQYAVMTGEQGQINFASSEREEVMKKLKDLDLQVQKSRKQEDSRHEIKHSKEVIHFDFQGLIKPVKALQTSEKYEETGDGNNFSTHKVESGWVSDRDSILPEEDWLDDAVNLEDFDSLDAFGEVEESGSLDGFEELKESDRLNELHRPDSEDNNIYDIDLIIRSMLKRSENLSPYNLLIDCSEEELAVIIDGELYMNEAATINLLEKAEAANTAGRTKEAAKLWETICFYSVDVGYMNAAFWNLVYQVYKSDMEKVKMILEAMTKKEKRLLKLVRRISVKERDKYEY